MDAVHQWALGICLTVLINAVVHYVIPSGSMEKMLRLVLGVFVLCGILLPLSKTLPSLDWEMEKPTETIHDTDGFAGEVERQIFSQAEQNIKQVVIVELEKNGYPWKNVSVRMDTNEDRGIVINQVVVTLDKDALVQKEELTAHLEKTLGLKTEVVWDGESG